MDSRSFDPAESAPRLGRVLWWSEVIAIAVIVTGFALELTTAVGDVVVEVGVGLLVATPFAAALVVAVLARARDNRMTAFAVATVLVAAVGIVAALGFVGR